MAQWVRGSSPVGGWDLAQQVGEVIFQSMDRHTHEWYWFLSRQRHLDGRLRDHQKRTFICFRLPLSDWPSAEISPLTNGPVTPSTRHPIRSCSTNLFSKKINAQAFDFRKWTAIQHEPNSVVPSKLSWPFLHLVLSLRQGINFQEIQHFCILAPAHLKFTEQIP